MVTRAPPSGCPEAWSVTRPVTVACWAWATAVRPRRPPSANQKRTVSRLQRPMLDTLLSRECRRRLVLMTYRANEAHPCPTASRTRSVQGEERHASERDVPHRNQCAALRALSQER